MSAGNRRFFDHLCCLLWCECREGCPTKSNDWHAWCDTVLHYYGTSCHAIVDGKDTYNTPRHVFCDRDLDCLQAFINTHTFRTIADAQRQIATDLFNECVACALNVLADRYAPPVALRPRSTMPPRQLTLFDEEHSTL